jgi:hypothetical protein
MKAKKSGGKRVNPAPGIHIARLVQILDYGTQVDSYSPDGRAKVEFVWELPEDLHVFNEDKGEQPLVVDRKFGNTLGRGSAMLECIEQMLGRKWDKDEDLDTLLGQMCQMNTAIEQDGEYENVVIKSLMPLGKDQARKKYPEYNEQFVLDLDNFNQEDYDSLPQYKKDNIAKSPEYAEAAANAAPPASRAQAPAQRAPAKAAPAGKVAAFAGKGKPAVKKR